MPPPPGGPASINHSSLNYYVSTWNVKVCWRECKLLSLMPSSCMFLYSEQSIMRINTLVPQTLNVISHLYLKKKLKLKEKPKKHGRISSWATVMLVDSLTATVWDKKSVSRFFWQISHWFMLLSAEKIDIFWHMSAWIHQWLIWTNKNICLYYPSASEFRTTVWHVFGDK